MLNSVERARFKESDVWLPITGKGSHAIRESESVLRTCGINIGRKFDAFFEKREMARLSRNDHLADEWATILWKPVWRLPVADGQSIDLTRSEIVTVALINLYERCVDEWNRAIDHRQIEALIRSIPFDEIEESYGTSKPVALRFRLMFRTLDIAMAVERSLNGGCPNGFARRSQRIVDMITLVEERMRKWPAGPDFQTVFDWQTARLLAYENYFSALAAHGRLVAAWTRGDEETFRRDAPAVRTELETRKKELERLGHPFASGIDAHLTTIDALDRFGSVGRYRLNEIRLVYCYPFALCGVIVEDIMTAHTKIDWAASGSPESGVFFSGATAGDLPLTDILRLSAHGMNGRSHRQRGGRILMPQVAIEPELGDGGGPFSPAKRIVLQPEIRLLKTGNHYVRFEMTESGFEYGDTGDASDRFITVHELYRAMRRATPACGEERFVMEGPSGRKAIETTLARLADAIVGQYIAALKRHVGNHPEISGVIDFNNNYHLVISARDLAERARDGQDPGAKLRIDHENASHTPILGLLRHPVQVTATMLEQWLDRSAGMDKSMVSTRAVDDTDGGVVTTSWNTSFIDILGAPDFFYRDYEDFAEFAATMGSAYLKWNRELDTVVGRTKPHLRELQNDAGGQDADPEKLAAAVTPVEEASLELNIKIAGALRYREWINSTGIVSNSVWRGKLDQLIANSSVRRLEAEMDRKIAAAEKIQSALTDISRFRRRRIADARRRQDVAAGSSLQFVVLFLAALLILEIVVPSATLRTHYEERLSWIGDPHMNWLAVTYSVAFVYLVVGLALGFVLHEFARQFWKWRATAREGEVE